MSFGIYAITEARDISALSLHSVAHRLLATLKCTKRTGLELVLRNTSSSSWGARSGGSQYIRPCVGFFPNHSWMRSTVLCKVVKLEGFSIRLRKWEADEVINDRRLYLITYTFERLFFYVPLLIIVINNLRPRFPISFIKVERFLHLFLCRTALLTTLVLTPNFLLIRFLFSFY